MQLDSLRQLYIDELKDLYSAEQQLVKALPKMADSATNARLRDAFMKHLTQTEGHVDRLEQIFDKLETGPVGKDSKGMEALIEEGADLMKEDGQPDVLDAGLISKAQHAEHYEIAGYGTARTYASMLGETEHARLLEQTLDEEKATDQLLTQLAESAINVEAARRDAAGGRAQMDRAARSDREVPRMSASDRTASSTQRTTRSDHSRDDAVGDRRDR